MKQVLILNKRNISIIHTGDYFAHTRKQRSILIIHGLFSNAKINEISVFRLVETFPVVFNLAMNDALNHPVCLVNCTVL
jgi:hypothetical protein